MGDDGGNLARLILSKVTKDYERETESQYSNG
jgi:hypothetical protein